MKQKLIKTLCETNPEAQRKKQNVVVGSLNLKVYNPKYFGHIFITMKLGNWESLKLLMYAHEVAHEVAHDFPIKWLGMLQWTEKQPCNIWRSI